MLPTEEKNSQLVKRNREKGFNSNIPFIATISVCDYAMSIGGTWTFICFDFGDDCRGT